MPGKVFRRGRFQGDEVEWLRLLRTVVAMANTAGGRILLERATPGLEPSALATRLREYVTPPLRGVLAEATAGGGASIRVPLSETRPHVFARDAPDASFHAGQIWLRDGDSDRPATGEEVHGLIRDVAAEFLERLSVGIRDPSFAFRLTDEGGIPVHLADDEESVPVSPNLARLYPYTTKTLGAALDRSTNWAATAIKVLRLKESREYAYGVPAPSGRVIQWRYSERCLERLRERLAAEPQWNPYHAL